MRAGRLDRLITIERYAGETLDALRNPVPSWTLIAADVPAEIVQGSAQEFIRAGAVEETAYVFRIRFLAGIALSDRVTHEGALYDIKELKELGRRAGLELRCLKIAGGN